ncbi:DNA polymerase-4 [Geosporobacter subterraneus DSM 17957]|uniref:DNA polymerase IV n=1 Tax=Geosporobacter subterraneus DSM 17957 TaxID=1121919 RepID=A0A1M6HI11_9FIRM|nr:DNA polymerase IV [Geosporobacter subterraneus]SHJ21823.1 DNA polymerase-4 [Geosporobacter subterraneus DSM 17957]
MHRSIVHIDMDAFYASVEQKDDPNLKNKPIVVGGSPYERGVVCTASYEARKYGIRSAMPTTKAKKLCPELLIIPVRMERYIEISNQIQEIFEQYTDFIEPISLDEAFLDVSGSDSIRIGLEIKTRIKQELNLTASVGISINKFLAKLASGYQKPDGFTVIEQKDIHQFLDLLPVGKLWGVGPKTEKELNRIGIYRVHDLLNYDESTLTSRFGKKGIELLNYARGKDDRPVENKSRRKSLGEECTFVKDTDDLNLLKEQILHQCEAIVEKLKKDNLLIRTLTVKVKYEDFTQLSRTISFTGYTRELKALYEYSEKVLIEKIPRDKKLRLIGIQVSNILYPNEPMQIQLNFDRMF